MPVWIFGWLLPDCYCGIQPSTVRTYVPLGFVRAEYPTTSASLGRHPMRLTPTSDGFTSSYKVITCTGAGHGNERDAVRRPRRVAVCHDGDGPEPSYALIFVWNRTCAAHRCPQLLVVHARLAWLGSRGECNASTQSRNLRGTAGPVPCYAASCCLPAGH